MNKQQLLQFIKESRSLIRGSTPEQKIKLIGLIKEAKRRLKSQPMSEISDVAIQVPENTDYLDEH